MRKSGNMEEAYNMAISDYNQNQSDEWAKRALSWCIYDILKSNASFSCGKVFVAKLRELKDLQMPASEELFWKNIVWPINAFLRDCSKNPRMTANGYSVVFDLIKDFHFIKPSLEYSLLLNAFLKGKEKDWHEIVDFCDWWNFVNFRPEDYQCETLPNGKKMPLSLVENAYITCSKVLLKTQDVECVQTFIPQLQALADEHPEMLYLNYYLGKMYIAFGGNDEDAMKSILPFVRKKQNEFWAWQLLAEALEKDGEKCMACLLRAANCHTQEQFLVGLYLTLARAFEQLGFYNDARFYLDKYCRVKQETQAKISNEAHKMMEKEWYAEALGKEPSYQLDYMSITNDLLYGDMPETDAVVSYVNAEKKIVTIVYGEKKEGFFKYDRFVKKLNVGDFLKIRIDGTSAEGHMKMLSVTKTDNIISTSFCKTIEGTVTSNKTKTVFFLKSGNQSYFITPKMKNDKLVVGETLSAVALYSYNRKKEEWGWICVKLLSKSN